MKPLVDRLRALPKADRDRILGACTAEQIAALRWCWHEFWLRPDQRAPGSMVGTGQIAPPGDWIWWIVQGGRGTGKSTAAGVWFDEEAQRLGTDFVGAITCATVDKARELIEDPKTGFLTLMPDWRRPEWNPSVGDGILRWSNGAVARVYSADTPRKGRGPNFNRWWLDDPPTYGVNGFETFKALHNGFRLLGHGLRAVVATTPPGDPPPSCPELLEMFLRPQFDPAQRDFIYSIAPTSANATNLDPDVERVHQLFKGSAAEEAELGGVYDPEGGAKTFAGVDFSRPPIRAEFIPDAFDTITVSIDPADSSSDRACEVGITAEGLTREGVAMVLEDASGHYTSDEWPTVAHDVFDRWEGRATRIRFVLEINRGTKDASLLKMAEMLRRQARGQVGIAVREIRFVTSRIPKADRAAPLVRVYRMGQIRHAPRGLEEVEKQLRRLDSSGRGRLDRADSAVHGLLDLFGLLDVTQAVVLGAAPAQAAPHTPQPLASVAVGPMPSAQPRMTAAAPFQSMPGAWSAGR